MIRYVLILVAFIFNPINLFCQQNMVLDSIIHFRWNTETSDFVEGGQRYYTYDASGYLIEEFRYGDSWEEWTWAEGTRYVYSYDANGNLIEETTYYWLDSSWKKTQKNCSVGCAGGQKIYSYDSQDNITLFLWNSWNNDANIWEVVDSIVYTYDGNGYLINEIIYGFYQLDINDWDLIDSIVYTYDANDNLTEETRYYWDEDHKKWKVRHSGCIYTYDANGNRTEEYRYNRESNKWFCRYIYTYDDSGNLTEEIEHVNWDNGNSDERWIYAYDALGNRTEKIRYYWEANKWLLRDSTLYAYDANGNLIEEMVGQYWDSETNDWRYLSKNVSYWSEFSTQIVTSSEYHQFNIYPNPTNDLLTIETDSPDHYSIEITSLNGQQKLIGEMEGTSYQIDLSTFQKGVYFITIRSKEILTTRKIIKL